MNCPNCNDNHWKIVNTREQVGANSIRRRRVCKACKARFTTHEFIFNEKHGRGLDPDLVLAISRAGELQSALDVLQAKFFRIKDIIEE